MCSAITNFLSALSVIMHLCVFSTKQTFCPVDEVRKVVCSLWFNHNDKETHFDICTHFKEISFIKISNIFYSFTFFFVKQRCISVTELLTD